MKYLKYIFLLCLILIDAFIIYHACLNSTTSSKKSDDVTDTVIDVIDKVTPSDTSIEEVHSRIDISRFIRKFVGHFSLFMICGIICLIAFLLIMKKRILYILVILHGAILAILTEVIQIFTEGRSGNVKDALIDSLGYLCGVGIVILVIYIYKKLKNKEKAYE